MMKLLACSFVILFTAIFSIIMAKDDKYFKESLKKYNWVYIIMFSLSLTISYRLSMEDRLRFLLCMYFICFFTHYLIATRKR